MSVPWRGIKKENSKISTANIRKDIRILIAEDDAIISETLKDYVEEMGHSVIGIVSNYEEAISFCDEQPDFIFLDIRMHGKDEGFKIAKTINESYLIPFLFLILYAIKPFRFNEYVMMVFGMFFPVYCALVFSYLFDKSIFNSDFDIVQSKEYFGSGASANRINIVSKRFKELVENNKLKGLSFTPIMHERLIK